MPIVRAGPLLVYFAHVPKCAGTAVERYLDERFGPLAFLDTRHHMVPSGRRWSRTSPQHIDLDVQRRLFPPGFFDHSFAVVRHPVSRLVSAYHFQIEMEQLPLDQFGFSAWLDGLSDTMAEDRFAFDNHIRPMVEMVPDDAEIFYLEHGLDALVPWFDDVTGFQAGPRAVRLVNERKGRGGGKAKVTPGPTDIERIAEIYAADFKRFGYGIDRNFPLAAAPVLSPEFIAERDAELARVSRPAHWLRKQLSRTGW